MLLAAAVLAPALLAFLFLRSGTRSDAEPVTPPPRVHEPTEGVVGAVDLWLGGALDPGPLSRAHASLSGVSTCVECHGAASQVIDERCVSCHAEIGTRAQAKVGWHGTFDQPCRTCHAEHRGAEADLIVFDREAFQHTLTRFPLRGEHASAKCVSCHLLLPLDGGDTKALHYQGVPSAACISCHVDPHAGGPRTPENLGPIRLVALDAAAPLAASHAADHPIAGRDCATCHRESGFGAAQLRKKGFDHGADTLFALRGAHAAVSCESCHTAKHRAEERTRGLAPGAGADPDCATCHEDPHRGEMRAASGCRSCHSEVGWNKGFDHDRDTAFALDDLHGRLDCASCHSDQRFRVAGTECQSCHGDAEALLAGRFGESRGEPDAHANAVDCAGCHRPTLAANRPTALARRCAECHAPEYAGLLGTWSASLDALAAGTKLDPEQAERLRRSGAHNFPLARELLSPPTH